MNTKEKEPIKVYIVNPPIEIPWKTQGDYLEEQKRAKRLYKVAIISMYISLIGVIATSVIAITTLRSYVVQ